jgi:hypothetical protein
VSYAASYAAGPGLFGDYQRQGCLRQCQEPDIGAGKPQGLMMEALEFDFSDDQPRVQKARHGKSIAVTLLPEERHIYLHRENPSAAWINLETGQPLEIV